MENEISEELRSLSALVASISRQTPYGVPEGYFINFPASSIQRINDVLAEPTNDVLAEPTNDVLAGLKESKPLTFSVPDGYFDGFAKGVLDRIKSGAGANNAAGNNQSAGPDQGSAADELPAILTQAGRNMPYHLPEGYFEELSPILTILREKTPYSVPVGYFDGLATRIMAKTAQSGVKPAGKVFSLTSHRLWKYSAAAVIAGFLFSIGWLRLHNGSTVTGTTPPVEIAKTISHVSDEELQSFLADQDTTLAQPDSTSTAIASVDLNDNDLKSLLGDVPDGELKQYMDEHGGSNNIATN